MFPWEVLKPTSFFPRKPFPCWGIQTPILLETVHYIKLVRKASDCKKKIKEVGATAYGSSNETDSSQWPMLYTHAKKDLYGFVLNLVTLCYSRFFHGQT